RRRGRRPRSRLRALRAADGRRPAGSAARPPRVRRGHRRPQPLSAQGAHAQQRRVQQQHVRGADAHAPQHGLRLALRAGRRLRVRVYATNALGTAYSPSAGTATVTAAPPANTAAPTVSGTPRDGELLTTDTGTWTGTPPLAYSYQWRRCDAGGQNCTSIA